jgi:hypothetical protein
MKFEFSRQIFEKCSTTNFHQNPSNGSRVVPCGQTDGHEANSRNFANAPKKKEFQLYPIVLKPGILFHNNS